MTGPEHFKQAEKLLKDAIYWDQEASKTFSEIARHFELALTARAQVHATLALAAATLQPPAPYRWSNEAVEGER